VEGGEIGEDIGFCHDIRKAGFKIYVDTGIKVGHLTKMTVDQSTWELYRLGQEFAKRQKEKSNLI
jgi:GT2 family glycosyltransferase